MSTLIGVTSLEDLRAGLHRDPRRVADEAGKLAALARARADGPALSRSLALRGRAYRSLGDMQLAERDLVEAVLEGERVGDDELAADARVGLAGVLSFAGRSDEAFTHLDE